MKKLLLLASIVLLMSIFIGCSSKGGASTSDITPAAAPTVVSVSPLNNETDVAISSAVSVTFSEAMDTASAEGAFLINNAAPTGKFTWIGNTMTFTPDAGFDYSTVYSCLVGFAAKNAAGIFIESPYAWSFTTIPDPTTPSVDPSKGKTGVDVSAVVSVTFTGEMNTASAESAFSMSDKSKKPVAGTFSWDAMNKIMTFTPGILLTGDMTYTCYVIGATYATGDSMSDYEWSFTTGPAPTVVSVSPAKDATGVSVSTTISITFSEAVQNPVGSISPLIEGTASVIGNTLTFTPNAKLAGGTTYTCTIDAQDLAGNNLAVPYTWSFTTE